MGEPVEELVHPLCIGTFHETKKRKSKKRNHEARNFDAVSYLMLSRSAKNSTAYERIGILIWKSEFGFTGKIKRSLNGLLKSLSMLEQNVKLPVCNNGTEL